MYFTYDLFSELPFHLEYYIYTQIPDQIFFLFFIATIISLLVFRNKKSWTLLISYYLFLICQTVVFRHSSSNFQIVLKPFHKLPEIIQGNTELQWEIILNILMFTPIGILLSNIFKGKGQLVILCGLAFSLTIELLQLVLCKGLCEFDDVIANMAGVTIGIGMYKTISLK